MAPGDRVAQRALPLRQVAGAAGEERQPPREALEQRLRGEGACPRGRQLDRQRQAVKPAADRLDLAGVVVREGKTGLRGLGSAHKEPHRRRPAGALGIGAFRGRRQGQWWQREGVLAGDAQHGPAGDQAGQPRTGGEELHDQRRGVDDVLEVVQDEQRMLAVQDGGNPLGE